jgi:hypothetical protein
MVPVITAREGAMLFNSDFGGIVQTCPWAEGGRMIAAGLLRPVMDDEIVTGVEATETLRGYFCGMPVMERLYPLLVEFVAGQRFPEIDNRRARWKLRALGMSEEGIEALRRASLE